MTLYDVTQTSETTVANEPLHARDEETSGALVSRYDRLSDDYNISHRPVFVWPRMLMVHFRRVRFVLLVTFYACRGCCETIGEPGIYRHIQSYSEPIQCVELLDCWTKQRTCHEDWAAVACISDHSRCRLLRVSTYFNPSIVTDL